MVIEEYEKRMKVSVIIPFYNSQRTIDICLNALGDQYIKPCEIILIDNGSSDKSSEIVHVFKHNHPYLNIILVEEPKRGPSAARNRGLKVAVGDIVAFTDSDCAPDKNWLKEIQGAFHNAKIGAVAGRVVGFKPESTLDKFHTVFTMKGLPRSQIFTEFTLVRGGFPTANLAVRKGVLDHIGGFDESMKIYSEDYDLCTRIYQAGFSIQYTTNAVVCHKHRNTLKGTWKQGFGFGTGHPVLLKKHFKQMVIIDLPRYQYFSQKWPTCIWLDLASADKKVAGLILLSIIWWPLSVLLVSYLLYLFTNMGSRLRQNGLKARFLEKWQLVFLLFLKSSAVTAGRVVGSFRNKILCF